jgi:hypothetical protein
LVQDTLDGLFDKTRLVVGDDKDAQVGHGRRRISAHKPNWPTGIQPEGLIHSLI